VIWNSEQEARRRQWGLDNLDADPRNLRTVDPLSAYVQRVAHGPPQEDVDLPGQLEDRSVDLAEISTDAAPAMFIDRLDPLGHSILYGTGGVGKGALACWWIVQLIRTGHRVLILDYEKHPEEWSRRIGSLDPGVHTSGLVRHLAPDTPIRQAADEIAWTCNTHELDYIVVDSAVMACGPDPLKPEAAAEYAAALLAITRPVLTLAHVTKLDDARYPFGSVFWHNLARTTWSLSGTDDEILLRHRKHNNYRGMGTYSLKITWSDDGKLREVYERVYGATILDRVKTLLEDGPLNIDEILAGLNDEEHKSVTKKILYNTLRKGVPTDLRMQAGVYSNA